jgi:hypothetical protein
VAVPGEKLRGGAVDSFGHWHIERAIQNAVDEARRHWIVSDFAR